MRRLNLDARPSGSKLGILLRMAGLFRPFRMHVTVLVVLIAATSAMQLIPALFVAKIVDEMTGDDGSRSVILALGLTAGGLILASSFLSVALGFVNQLIGQGMVHNLRRDLHAHLQRLAVRFFTETRTGEILSRVMTDVTQVQQTVTGTFTEFLTNVITLGIALGLMASLEWRLALLFALALPLWTYPTIRVGTLQRRLQREWSEEAASMSAQLDETFSVSGAMLVKTFGREGYENDRFSTSNETLRSLSVRRMMAGRWFNMGTELFGQLAVIVVYLLGALAVLNGDISAGQVVAFAILAQRVFTPFRGIMRINTTMLSSLALFERIFEYMDLPVEVDERPDARTLERPRGTVRFDDVTFAYTHGSRPALQDVSFAVEPGQMVALVGPSGAGKTTVTYLLQRFYDPQHGRALLDGHDLRDLTLASISSAMGAVLQDTYLFHTTLLDNIRYGRLEASDAEVRAAASTAGLDEMLDRLPDGLLTVVGERGYRLSGGEKQRVAIARAVLKDPPVLVLDEATASLDSRLEREIREAMVHLAEGRTTIVIAHRLSTVVAADMILVLDRGHLVERGKHEELLARGGLYATLHREQFSHEGAPQRDNGPTPAAGDVAERGVPAPDGETLARRRGG